MITGHLIQMLLTYPPVSTQTGRRIKSRKTEQDNDARPYVIARQRAGGHVKSLAGREGTAKAIVEVTVYADDGEQADELLALIGKLLDGFKGTLTLETDTIKILGIFELDEDDEDWMPSPHADEVGAYTASTQFKIWHTEQVVP